MKNQESCMSTKTNYIASPYDYHFMLQHVSKTGKDLFGRDFVIEDVDKPVINRLLSYFLKDKRVAESEGISLHKGILLVGPVGCGKTSILKIMSNFCSSAEKPVFRSCSDVVFDFNTKGYEGIEQYTRGAFWSYSSQPLVHCFDDLGPEPIGNYYGNNTNVIAEILLSRYNYFISRKMITHITTNMNSDELEGIYGNRIRSRMREMFNLVVYSNLSTDKRK